MDPGGIQLSEGRDTERQGRSLIYDAARGLDRRNGDAIPNYLYDYLR